MRGSILAGGILVLALWSVPQVNAQCETGRVAPTDGLINDQFGGAVDLSGNWMVVGSPLHDGGIGAAYLFERIGSTWFERAKFQPFNPAGFEEYGRSVAIAGDFSAVGMPKADRGALSDAGQVEMFRRTGATWTREFLTTGTTIPFGAEFGTSVSVYEDAVLVGAPFTDGVTTTGLGNSGSAYLFRRDPLFSQWLEESALVASDAAELDTFGFAVKLHGNWAFVGAPADKDPNISASNTIGSVYVFLKQGNNWLQVQKLTASDAATQTSNRRFGATLDTDGNVLIVGERQGQTAYVFRRVGTVWAEEAILKKPAAHAAGNDQFATAVAIEGDLALVGAPLDDDNGLSNSGTVFAFRHSGGSWTEQPLIYATDAAANTRLGASVAMDGPDAVAGAVEPSLGAGAAYVYSSDVVSDCNANTIEDACELRLDPLLNGNGNGLLDACECTSDEDCNDKNVCTTDTCDRQTGNCVTTPIANVCLINGQCFSSGTVNPTNECQVCNPAIANEAWSAGANGQLCGPTQNECASASCQNGSCIAVPRPSGTACGPPPSGCEQAYYCNGQGGCIAGPPPGEWQSLNPYPGVSGTVLCSTGWDPDGPGPHPELLVVGGFFTIPGVPGTNNIAAWDRSRWIPLGQGFNGAVSALAVGSDQIGPVLYAGGAFTSSGATSLLRVAKWNRLSWSAVGSGFSDNVYALYAGEDQSGPFLYAGGKFTLGSTQFAAVAKWDGAQWTALGEGMSSCQTSLCGAYIRSLIFYDSATGSDLYASGKFNYADGASARNIARWRNGLWESVGAGITASGSTMAIFDDGSGKKLCTGAVGPSYNNRVACWEGQTWSLLPAIGGTDIATLVADNDESDPALYVAQSLMTTRKWDGSSWTYIEATHFASSDRIETMSVLGEGTSKRLFAGGDFHFIGELGVPISALNIAAWDGGRWMTLSKGVTLQYGGSMGRVANENGESYYFTTQAESTETLEAQDLIRWDGRNWSSTNSPPNTYSVNLTNIESGPFSGLYAIDVFSDDYPKYAVHIEKFDGSQWSQVGGDFTGRDDSFAAAQLLNMRNLDDGTGEALYACGRFETVGGTPLRNVARWDGSSWSGLGSGVGVDTSDTCYAIEVFDDGTGPQVYAGGTFHFSPGAMPFYLVRWNGNSWQGVSGIDCAVNSLKSFNDGSGPKLFIGVSSYFGANPNCERLVTWDGANWSLPGGGIDARSVGLSVQDWGQGERLILGAAFTGGTSNTIGRIFMWDGQSWIQAFSDVDGGLGVSIYDDGNGASILGRGNFDQIGSVASYKMARWSCPFPLGDIQRDRIVNLLDFHELYPCLAGPYSAFPGTCVTECDIDADFDVDLADFAALQRAFDP